MRKGCLFVNLGLAAPVPGIAQGGNEPHNLRFNPVKRIPFLIASVLLSSALAEDTVAKRHDIPYADQADPLRTLDVYSPPDAKNLPVVVWIHGGGWQAGSRSQSAANAAPTRKIMGTPQYRASRGLPPCGQSSASRAKSEASR